MAPKRKKPNTNKRCPSCATKFSKKLEACPKCGYKPTPIPSFLSMRKPLTSGGKLKVKK